MATLNIPDDMTIAELLSMAHAAGKSLSISLVTNRPEEKHDGNNSRTAHLQPVPGLADQQSNH